MKVEGGGETTASICLTKSTRGKKKKKGRTKWLIWGVGENHIKGEFPGGKTEKKSRTSIMGSGPIEDKKNDSKEGGGNTIFKKPAASERGRESVLRGKRGGGQA